VDRFVYVELKGYVPRGMVEELNKNAPKGYRFVSLLPPPYKNFYGFVALFERVEEEGFMAATKRREENKENEEKIEEQDGWVNPIHRTMNTSSRQVGDSVRLRNPCTCGDYGRIIEVGFDGDPNVYRVEMSDGCIGMVLEKDIK
jgi:hypothetical protein